MQFQNNYPLKNITTLSIGGPARQFVQVATQEDLIEAIKYAKDRGIHYLVIGGGSNLLVADEGVNSLVVKNSITGITPDGNTVTVKSGTTLQNLVDFTISNNLSGLQKLAGIPGTVGGAVYGNAGAYGQSISDCLDQVTAYDGANIITVSKDECSFSYRDSIFKRNKFIILEVVFQMESGNVQTLQQEAKDILAKREIKYPPGIKCPGSFFKNLVASQIPAEILNNIPPDKIVFGKLPAGALLEMVGAKGQAKDGIEIAPYHANLFVNQGTGSAKAFYDLAKTYAQKVKEKFGITLEPEVQLINLSPL